VGSARGARVAARSASSSLSPTSVIASPSAGWKNANLMLRYMTSRVSPLGDA